MALYLGPFDMALDRASSRLQLLDQYICSLDLRSFVRTESGFYVCEKNSTGKIEEYITLSVEHPDTLDRDCGIHTEIWKDESSSMQLTPRYTRIMVTPAGERATANLVAVGLGQAA